MAWLRKRQRQPAPAALAITIPDACPERSSSPPCARWRELTGDEEAAAVAALRELAGGRADLLAEVAGIFEGASEGRLDEPLARCAARLCRLADADLAAIPGWAAEGRRRAVAASMPPLSGGSVRRSTQTLIAAARSMYLTRNLRPHRPGIA